MTTIIDNTILQSHTILHISSAFILFIYKFWNPTQPYESLTDLASVSTIYTPFSIVGLLTLNLFSVMLSFTCLIESSSCFTFKPKQELKDINPIEKKISVVILEKRQTLLYSQKDWTFSSLKVRLFWLKDIEI